MNTPFHIFLNKTLIFLNYFTHTQILFNKNKLKKSHSTTTNTLNYYKI
jgi:hypothetical protein